jgi:Spy/CpxP family protein refolding chaperone
VRKTLALVLFVCVCSLSIGWTAARQVKPAGVTMTPIEDVLVAVREDLQNDRAETMAKNLKLTSDEAAKFWPVFSAYQKEQNLIMDEQLKGIQRYIESFDTLDDAGALQLISAHLARDAKMVSLRQKWLGEFQKVAATKIAARAMQIDRRLSLAQQMRLTAKIPLVH